MERSIRVLALEAALSKRSMSQQEMAHALNVHYETIEKIFRTKIVSLDRFLKICQKLDLTLRDLLLEDFPSVKETVYLTIYQEDFFCENTKALCFFDLLTQSNNISAAQSIMKVDKKETEELLNQLSDLGTIAKVYPNSVDFSYGRPIHLQESGPLKKYLTLRAIDELDDCENGSLMDSYKFALVNSPESAKPSILRRLEDLIQLSLEEESIQMMIDRLFNRFGLISTICHNKLIGDES